MSAATVSQRSADERPDAADDRRRGAELARRGRVASERRAHVGRQGSVRLEQVVDDRHGNDGDETEDDANVVKHVDRMIDGLHGNFLVFSLVLNSLMISVAVASTAASLVFPVYIAILNFQTRKTSPA